MASKFGDGWPFVAGHAFSMVTMPCSSPTLAAVLAAAAAHSVPGLGVATMISFSVGYRLLVVSGFSLALTGVAWF